MNFVLTASQEQRKGAARSTILGLLIASAKTSRRNPAVSLGPALVANSVRRGQEKRTMRKPDVQIGNSGLNV
jgi:hypothetical protein